MEEIKIGANKSYFAAANSYRGFVSLFDEIFNPKHFKHIYVIKGGPGTGKSSLMKRLAKSFINDGVYTEAIYCSSDPTSLDGVIIKKNNNKIALLDGTSPHERDAIIPGAIDEIINLGDGFNKLELIRQREEILNLAEKKKNAYKKAYSMLDMAGNIWRQIYTIYRDMTSYYVAESVSEKLSELSESGNSDEPTRIFSSSFNKNGYTTIDISENESRRKIRISGDGITEHIVLGLLYKKLQKKRSLITVCPSPLDTCIFDKIITDDVIYEVNNQLSDFDTTSIIERTNNTNSELIHLHTKLLILAQAAFKDASDYHFSLEEIYKNAIDFENNNRTEARLYNEISEYLN